LLAVGGILNSQVMPKLGGHGMNGEADGRTGSISTN
jgi:hypothetical protein